MECAVWVGLGVDTVISGGNERKKGKGENGRATQARSRFFPFGYAQGQNDN